MNAKQTLHEALNTQKTIAIPKLNRLLEEANYGDTKALIKQNRKLQKKIKRQQNTLRRMNDGEN